MCGGRGTWIPSPPTGRFPTEISDGQAVLMSDIPTGWFGADLADIEEGDGVAVFGWGPVGQFAVASAKILGAQVNLEDRLSMARNARRSSTLKRRSHDSGSHWS
jgi:threonine dehydrogenase-like Zn-dependent dehydrogenase